ncbi:MAG: DUF2971 domain-containing protein [Nitrospira sp.]
MNDANEIKYGAERLKTMVAERQSRETDQAVIEFLIEFREWLNQLIDLPHYIFVFSLTEKGNLLSQWRAYTPSGELGVSIGFSQAGLMKLAAERGYELIKCLYDRNEQIYILNSALDVIVAKFLNDRPTINTMGHPANQKYLSYFYQHSEMLLKTFCQIKDPYFQEESEWRLVSKYYKYYTDPNIKFRDGRTTLVPYIEFSLDTIHEDSRLFEQVYVGPSPNLELSFSAIGSFLSNKKACNLIINSLSPYRQ